MKRRVAVTGLGAVTSIGATAEEFWHSCLEGRSRAERTPEAWQRHGRCTSSIWAPLPLPDLSGYPISRIEELQQDGVSILALAATFQALRQAGISWQVRNPKRNTLSLLGVDPARVLVSAGTGIGGVSSLLSNYQFHILGDAKDRLRKWTEAADWSAHQRQQLSDLESDLEAPTRMSPLVVPRSMPNTVAGAVSIKLCTHGPAHTHCSACAAGTVAIGHALHALRFGVADVGIAIGAEWMDDAYGGLFRAFDLAKTLVQDGGDPLTANRPFDRDRTGFLFSAGGAGVLLLEELEHARRRGATILAELAGFGESSDAHNIMAPAPGGEQIERAIRTALEDAGLQPEEIGYVNAHGTGTVANDGTEAEILRRIFGPGVAVNSTKSLLGHTLGASGALEAVVTVRSLEEQRVHACSNLQTPVADLAFVAETRELPLEAAISQSFAFGGHNAVLAFRRA